MTNYTVGQCIRLFIVSLEAAGRSLNTISAYEYRLRILSPEQLVADVRPNEIDAVIVRLRRKTKSVATIAGHIQAIKSFFRWCKKRGYAQDEPAAHLLREKPRIDLRNRAMTQEDFEKMLFYSKQQDSSSNFAILLFLADTGCRVGELCSLTIERVDLKMLEAEVRGKTGSRFVDFTYRTRDVIREIIGDRKNGHVFLADNGNPLTVHNIYARLRWVAKRVGIVKRFNPHAIRHRVGQAWIDQGANLELVRLKLGHKDISTTAHIYGNQDRERVKAASQKYSILKSLK